MAVRDRNMFAWQAYVITMTLVSVGLLFALGWVLFTGATNTKRAEDAIASRNEINDNLRKENSKVQALLHMVGGKQSTEAEFQTMMATIGADGELEAAKTKFDKDMSLLGINEPSKNYATLAENLMKAIRDRNVQIETTAKELERLTKDLEQVRTQETLARQAAEKDRDRLDKELALARDDFRTKEGELQKTIEQLNNEKAQLASTFAVERKKYQAERDVALAKVKDAEEFKRTMEDFITTKVEREDFESSQGDVVQVDQGGVELWVNLGKKDGVRVGHRFSILNRDTTRISQQIPKAQIEITSVMDDIARAKVLQDKSNVPVIAGDLVYSPTFGLSGKASFALLGKMDIDGDGTDDRDYVRSLIENNGSVVVEEVGPDGKSRGPKLSIQTTYLIVGDTPKGYESGGTIDPRLESIGKAYRDMERRADEFGITKMPLEKLMRYLRKYDDDRTIPMGDASRTEDFRDRSGPVRSAYEGVTKDFGIRPNGPLSGSGRAADGGR